MEKLFCFYSFVPIAPPGIWTCGSPVVARGLSNGGCACTAHGRPRAAQVPAAGALRDAAAARAGVRAAGHAGARRLPAAPDLPAQREAEHDERPGRF